jgi:hypothetical protein
VLCLTTTAYLQVISIALTTLLLLLVCPRSFNCAYLLILMKPSCTEECTHNPRRNDSSCSFWASFSVIIACLMACVSYTVRLKSCGCVAAAGPQLLLDG